MKKVSVGVVLPSSTIMPMGRDFESGLKKGLKEQLGEEYEVELIPEFVGQGSRRTVGAAIDKLLDYHVADVITGIVSNRVMVDVAERFEKKKKPFLVNNLGEQSPAVSLENPYIFLNSTHTWQQIWSLANWAVKRFGKKGMFISGLYDAGYAFLNMMRLGMVAADEQCELPFSVAPVIPPGKLSDPKAVFAHIEEFKPDFIISFFCGEEATIFLEEYIARGLHKTLPVLGLPFLLESFDAKGEEIEIYTAANSYTELESGLMNGTGEVHMNPFPVLGFESGLLIGEAFKRSNGQKLDEALREVQVTSERGPLHISAIRPGQTNKIYLVKNTHRGDKHTVEKHIVEQLPTLDPGDPLLVSPQGTMDTGWDNPYLGV